MLAERDQTATALLARYRNVPMPNLGLNAAETDDAAADVVTATDGGAHGVLITAPSLGAFAQGIAMTRRRGTCVLVGLPPGEFPVPLFDVVARCLTIRGSFVGTRQDMAEALDFAPLSKSKTACAEVNARDFS